MKKKKEDKFMQFQDLFGWSKNRGDSTQERENGLLGYLV